MAQVMEGVKKMEEINGKKFGDLKESSSRICSFRCKSIYAGYDGYYPQPRS